MATRERIAYSDFREIRTTKIRAKRAKSRAHSLIPHSLNQVIPEVRHKSHRTLCASGCRPARYQVALGNAPASEVALRTQTAGRIVGGKRTRRQLIHSTTAHAATPTKFNLACTPRHPELLFARNLGAYWFRLQIRDSRRMPRMVRWPR